MTSKQYTKSVRMDQISPSFKELDELYTIIEDTFDTCSSSRDEVYWLVSILKLMLNSPNKYTKYSVDNMHINYWMYSLYPIVEKWKKKYHHSTSRQVVIKRKIDAKKT